jgi:glycosyltransferase involved in cell wall biosynthesis
VPRSLLVFEPPDGGVAQHVLDLARGLPDRGWEVTVAGPAESDIYPTLEAAGIPHERLPIGRALRPGPYARAFEILRRRARSGRYDLLHVHSSKAGAIGRPAARLGRMPVVYTPHCFPFIGPQSARRRVLSRAVERGLALWTDAVVCVSEDERREALRARIDAKRLHVVHNGSARCKEEQAPDAELRAYVAGRPSAGAIAVLRPQKGVDVFVRAAPAILESVPEARLAVVGDGPMRGELDELVRRCGVGDRLRFFTFSPPSSRYLQALDLFVLPSLWEAFPISVLEALACGVPQVASDVGGTGEALVEGRTGLLCPPGDPAALASAVAALLRSPDRRSAMAEASRARHSDCFGLDRMLARTADLYRSVVCDPRQPAKMVAP